MKLVDFEQYMMVDDQADYPMVIRLELDFEGDLDRDRLQRSFDQTAMENPLLRAKVSEASTRLYWTEAEPTRIEWTDDLPEIMRLDLRVDSGLRIFAKQTDGKTFLRLFIHHSIADGAGINHFVEQWLIHYQQFGSEPLKNHASQDPDYTSRCLRERDRFGMSAFKYMLRAFQEFCGAMGVMEFFTQRPTAMGPQQADLPDEPCAAKPLSHRFKTLVFSKDETKKVIANIKNKRFTVNDAMVTSLFESCQHWIDNNQAEESKRRIRIMIPMDMRSKKQPEKFVGNKVSMIFVDRRPGRYKSLSHLCWYVWIEMLAIKTMKLGLTFAHLIKYFRVRRRLHKMLRRDKSIATTILSNLGPILTRSPLTDEGKGLTSDGICLSRYHVYAPIRPHTWITFVVSTYRDQLQIHSTSCANFLSENDVEQILSRFKSNVLDGFDS